MSDLLIVGAGPAGLAAAVYGGVRRSGRDGARGGCAWGPGRLELSDRELPRISDRHLRPGPDRTRVRPGAEVRCADHHRQRCDWPGLRPRIPIRSRLTAAQSLGLARSSSRPAHEYRKPPLDRLAQYEGAGVYYAATPMEAQLCRDEEVVVVGGGNSAGQAAVFLAQSARRVHMLVRGDGLAATMSRYLIRRIEDNPAIVLRTRTEIVSLEGDGHLERVEWRDDRTGSVETNAIRHVFLMTGAEPNTRWLNGCLTLDDSGFIKTGPDLSRADLSAARMAAIAGTVSARDQPSGRLCRRRREGRQHQARGVRGRRRLDRGRVRAPGPATVARGQGYRLRESSSKNELA